MRNCRAGDWDGAAGPGARPPPTHQSPSRWLSAVTAPRGRRGRRPHQATRRAPPRRPHVVELSLNSTPDIRNGTHSAKSVRQGSSASDSTCACHNIGDGHSDCYGLGENYALRPPLVRHHGSERGSRCWSGLRRSVKKYKNARHDDDCQTVYSVCTTVSSTPSRASSDSVHSVVSSNWEERTRAAPDSRVCSVTARGTSYNGDSGSLPAGVSKIQEMVKSLRKSRMPATCKIDPQNLGFRELSIHGHQNSVDPVLAWRLDHDLWHPTTRGVASELLMTACAPATVDSPSDEDEWIVSMNGEERATIMETISITPWRENMEEDEDVLRYESNYTRRTGQILNYYVEKDSAPDEPDSSFDSRHDRCHPKVSRSVPSQASLYRPVISQVGTYPQHWRSSTVPSPRKSGEDGGTKTSINGRVFMGRRIHPPQKIVPAYRPKPVLRQGRSFVQIHQPMTLMPRSQTADYALRTRSVTSNSYDEDSTDEYETQHEDARIDHDMRNLRIIGKSLRTGKKDSRWDASDRLPPAGFSTSLYRDSSRCFPSVNADIQTQIQTISPPYSSQVSSQYLSTAGTSRVTVMGLEDLCVYNHVNPSPRRATTADPQLAMPPQDPSGNPQGGTTHPALLSRTSIYDAGDMQRYMPASHLQDANYVTPQSLPRKLNDTVIVESGSLDDDSDLWLGTPGDEQSDSGVVLDAMGVGEDILEAYGDGESNITEQPDECDSYENTEDEDLV